LKLKTVTAQMNIADWYKALNSLTSLYRIPNLTDSSRVQLCWDSWKQSKDLWILPIILHP